MALLDRHIAFIEALRTAGLPVSLSEDLDSVEVLTHIGFADRDSMRAGLAASGAALAWLAWSAAARNQKERVNGRQSARQG